MKKIPKYLNDLLNPKWVFSQQASCGKEKEALIGGETWSECQEEEYKTLWKEHQLVSGIGMRRVKEEYEKKLQDPLFRKKLADDYIKKYYN